jgi:hypothetical protein
MLLFKPAVSLAAIFLAWCAPTGHAQSPKRIEIIAKRFTYDPDTITLKKGGTGRPCPAQHRCYARH